jgi:transcription elongation GreA/GreB family factor
MTTHTTDKSPLYLSKKGMKDLQKHISQLEKEHSQTMTELRELDRTDAHEERLARIEKLAMLELIENELASKREQLENAKPLPRKRDAIKVAIGSVVDLVDQQGRMMRYTLVNSIEANPSDGRISILSPLGQSLIGKTAKQTVEWTSNRLQTRRLQLVRVH